MSAIQTCGTHATRTRGPNKPWSARTKHRAFDFRRVNLNPSRMDIKAACLMAWAMVKADGLDTLDSCLEVTQHD